MERERNIDFSVVFPLSAIWCVRASWGALVPAWSQATPPRYTLRIPPACSLAVSKNQATESCGCALKEYLWLKYKHLQILMHCNFRLCLSSQRPRKESRVSFPHLKLEHTHTPSRQDRFQPSTPSQTERSRDSSTLLPTPYLRESNHPHLHATSSTRQRIPVYFWNGNWQVWKHQEPAFWSEDKLTMKFGMNISETSPASWP